jgi:hypothetical protein
MSRDKQQKTSFGIADMPAEFSSSPTPNKSLEHVGLPPPVFEPPVAPGCYVPRLVVDNRRFGITYQSDLEGSSICSTL